MPKQLADHLTQARSPSRPISIWWFAFGYFAAYAPYSAMTKALSKGLFEDPKGPLSGFQLLPATVAMSAICMVIFLTAVGWWKYATQRQVFGLTLPSPTRFTLFSGLCTSAIIGTTTLAYTFTGVSIVFVMLLMRGGVLVIAPIVDMLTGRSVKWFCWVALALSLSALVVAFSERGGYDITAVCAADIGIYLAAYFMRFRLMSRKAKSDDPDVNKRYFVEEQIIAAPSLLVVLGLVAVFGGDGIPALIRAGFTEISSRAVLLPVLIVGVLSQFTGIFGSLIFLDKRDNAFCVPINRSSSILAGIVASLLLSVIFGQRLPSPHQLLGAGLIIGAILFLSIPPLLARRA